MKTLLLLATLFSSVVSAAEVDTDRSVFNWKGSKITGSFHEGTVSPKSSNLTVSDKGIESGEIVMDLTTLTVSDITKETTAAKFLRHMKSTDFFNVEKFPTATLKLNSIENGEAKADLSVLGQTQSVTFPIKKEGDKYTGKLIFDRTKFGVTYRSGNFFVDLGDKVINDEIEITFEVYIKE